MKTKKISLFSPSATYWGSFILYHAIQALSIPRIAFSFVLSKKLGASGKVKSLLRVFGCYLFKILLSTGRYDVLIIATAAWSGTFIADAGKRTAIAAASEGKYPTCVRK